jgi:hypothetical protein
MWGQLMEKHLATGSGVEQLTSRQGTRLSLKSAGWFSERFATGALKESKALRDEWSS